VTYRTYHLGLLAEVLGGQGPPMAGDGLALLEEALHLSRQTGEGLYEAELYRLRGEIVLRAADDPLAAQARAEEDFLRALEIARRQEAKSLELRAVMSLARLGRRLGRTREMRQLLAETYAWFAEGFDTTDLIEARKLLRSLT